MGCGFGRTGLVPPLPRRDGRGPRGAEAPLPVVGRLLSSWSSSWLCWLPFGTRQSNWWANQYKNPGLFGLSVIVGAGPEDQRDGGPKTPHGSGLGPETVELPGGGLKPHRPGPASPVPASPGVAGPKHLWAPPQSPAGEDPMTSLREAGKPL